MNGDEWKRLDERLRSIETHFSASIENQKNVNNRLQNVEARLDEVRLALAEKKGEEKEAAKQGGKWGAFWGAVSGAVILIAKWIID